MLNKCPTCEVLRQQNQYLQGLVNRMMDMTYPKVEKELAPELKPQDQIDEPEQITIGEG